MKFITINVHDPETMAVTDRLVIREGLIMTIGVRTSYLVSAGQTMDVLISAGENRVIQMPEPGSLLADARGVVPHPVKIDHTHDYRFIPPDRPLWAILVDVVAHDDEFPTHGTDCVCMDQFAYEVRRHIGRALPATDDVATWTNTEKWSKAFGQRMRIRHVLRMAGRDL
jgi:hypothetical protein